MGAWLPMVRPHSIGIAATNANGTAIVLFQWVVCNMNESELLFTADTGGYRSPSVLNKPFEEVGRAIGLRQRFTQRGLQRTFNDNDLARAAQVGVVNKSISGH